MERRLFIKALGTLLGVGGVAKTAEAAPGEGPFEHLERVKREVGEAIVSRWPDLKEAVEALPPEQRDGLMDLAIDAYLEKPPTDERAVNMVEFVKSLHFNPRAVEAMWKASDHINDGTAVDVRIHGAIPVRVWVVVSKRSLDHCILLHKHFARRFLEMIIQTRVGDQLPHLRDRFKRV